MINDTSQLGFRYITSTAWDNATGKNDNPSKADLLNHVGEVIFIEATNQLYVATGKNEGTYFGLTDAQKANLEAAYAQVFTEGEGTIKNKVSALEGRVEMTTEIAGTLVSIVNGLKKTLDGGSYTAGQQGHQATITTDLKTSDAQSITNVVAAINRLYELVSAAQAAAGVTKIKNTENDTSITISNQGVGEVTISTDASKIKTTANGPAGYQSVTVEAALIGHQTTLSGHQTALEGHQTTLSGHQTALENLDTNTIKKSSSAASTLAGDSNVTLTPANLTDADAIVTALVTAYNTLVGTGTHNGWGENEKKTLGTLRDLIDKLRKDLTTLSTAVGTLSDADFASITDAINKIKAELADPNNQGLRTFLDDAQTILGGSVASGPNEGKYETKSGTGGASEYATNLGDIITNLEKEIAAAKDAASAAGVTSLNSKTGAVTIANGTGTSVDNSGASIVINATAAATTTATLTQSQTGYGATTASGSTIQTALQDVNNAASSAGKAANDANTAAAAAQITANNALAGAQAAQAQLKWTVV